ncbi:hypothetical protein BC831DRAFT_436155 [Entophlyctis helioformis]|nr:hypothetical protein BC831DRAFT_436155 [Entophlyctis helioformis]
MAAAQGQGQGQSQAMGAQRGSELESMLAKEREDKRRLDEALTARIMDISRLEDELRKERDEKRVLNARLESLANSESRIRDLEANLSNMSLNGGSYANVSAASSAASAAEITQLQKRIAELEALLSSSSSSSSTSGNTLELQSLLDAERRESERLRNELLIARRATDDMLSERGKATADLQSKLAVMEAELSRATATTSESRTKNAQLEAFLRAKDAEVEALNHKATLLAEKDGIIAALNQRLQEQTRMAAADMATLNQRLIQESQAKDALVVRLTSSRPTPTPRNVDPAMWALFYKFDPYHTKKLDAGQLSKLLETGPWPPLSTRSVVLLIRTYDRNGDFVDFDFLVQIWPALHKWKTEFQKHSTTGAKDTFVFGYVPVKSLRAALKDIDITVPSKTIELVCRRAKYPNELVGWDEFVTLAARFRAQLNEFEHIDTDRDKAITILFDQYMDVLNRCLT